MRGIFALVNTHVLPSDLWRTCNGLFYCLSKWASDVTTGLFWAAVLIGFCVVIFTITVRYGNPRAFGYASFTGMLASIFLVIMGLIPFWIASIFILTGVLGLAIMIMNEK